MSEKCVRAGLIVCALKIDIHYLFGEKKFFLVKLVAVCLFFCNFAHSKSEFSYNVIERSNIYGRQQED